MTEKKKAEQALMRRLQQPGHKAELRAFHAARRGTSVRGNERDPDEEAEGAQTLAD